MSASKSSSPASDAHAADPQRSEMTKLERLLNLIAALIHTVVPLTAEEIRERVEGYGGTNEASFRQGVRARQGRTARDGHPHLGRLRTRHRSSAHRLSHRRREYAGAVPELTPDELATLHLAANLVRVQGLPTDAGLLEVRRRAYRGRLGRADGGPAHRRQRRSVVPGRVRSPDHAVSLQRSGPRARAAAAAAQSWALVHLRFRPRTPDLRRLRPRYRPAAHRLSHRRS